MDYREIIARIGIARQRMGMSARELSGQIGKNENYISKLECRAFILKTDTLLAIIEALNMSAQEFFYEDFGNYQTDHALLSTLRSMNEEQKKIVASLFETWRR